MLIIVYGISSLFGNTYYNSKTVQGVPKYSQISRTKIHHVHSFFFFNMSLEVRQAYDTNPYLYSDK